MVAMPPPPAIVPTDAELDAEDGTAEDAVSSSAAPRPQRPAQGVDVAAAQPPSRPAQGADMALAVEVRRRRRPKAAWTPIRRVLGALLLRFHPSRRRSRAQRVLIAALIENVECCGFVMLVATLMVGICT